MNSTIRSFLDLSTEHLTPSDAGILENSYNGFTVICAGEHGYFVWVPDHSEMDECIPNFRQNGLSDSFVSVMKYARSKNCDFILFDADGPTNDDLPKFEWR